MRLRKGIAGVWTCVALALLGWGGAANAVDCPAPNLLDRYFQVTTVPDTSICFDYGTGNENNDAAFQTLLTNGGYVLLDKSDDAITGSGTGTQGALTGSPSLITGASGTFSISAALVSAYESFIVLFKSGNNENPAWAAFLLPDDVLSGNWAISDNNNVPIELGADLSHASLYGVFCGEDCDPPAVDVPLPAAAWLLLSGMVGLFGIGRRRRVI